ncbi:hypothetical protein RMATCC62417_07457 [Rhizopus microsporus]|nr:hypothetical protein RMATCC62417_07457 [Rhizopus microsporus]
MQLNDVSEQMGLTLVGQFVETMVIGTHYNGNYSDMLEMHMTFDDFMQLVDYCPNVIRLVIHMPSFESCVAEYLLEIDDRIKWNLHYVEMEPTDESEMIYYYKYKDSIKEIIAPPDVRDLQFIKSFPMLDSLSLSSSFIHTTIQGFMFIFDTCHRLSNFSAEIKLEEDISLPLDHGPYPSLTRLEVHTSDSLIPKTMIDYIIKRFVNPSDRSLTVCPPCSFLKLNEIYCQLLRFLMTSPKESLMLRLTVRNFWVSSDTITSCIRECFNHISWPPSVNQNTYNSACFAFTTDDIGSFLIETSLERPTRKTTEHKRQFDAYAPGLSLQTYQPI